MKPLPTLARIARPLARLQPDTLAEAHAATLRLRAETAALKRRQVAVQRFADVAAEQAGEGRLLPEGRTNFHGD
jgi:hypothetical protein